MNSKTTWRGWSHPAQVLRRRVFSPASWAIFVLRLAVEPARFDYTSRNKIGRKQIETGGHAENRTQVFSLRTRCSTTELAAHLKLVDAMGFGPILGISPVRLPQTPCLFGFMHPLKLVDTAGIEPASLHCQ